MLELKILPYALKKHHRITTVDKLVPRPNTPPSRDTIIQPVYSSYGTIKTILITLPKDQQAQNDYNILPLIMELARAMPHVNIVMFYRGTEFNSRSPIGMQLGNIPNLHLEQLPRSDADSNLSIWAQDHFYPLTFQKKAAPTENCWALGKTTFDLKATLENIADSIQKYNPKQTQIIKTTGLPFLGGNILVGRITDKDYFLLLGENDYKSNEKEWFGKKPILVRTNEHSHRGTWEKPSKHGFKNILPSTRENPIQPLFHIDLFLTLAGFNEDRTIYQIVVGQPTLGSTEVAEKEPELHSYLQSWLENVQKSIDACVAYLKKDLEKVLEKALGHSIEVKAYPIPLVLTYQDTIAGQSKTRNWFWVSYNNCLVEITPNTSKVWLPSYGCQASNFSDKILIPPKYKKHVANLLNLEEDKVAYGDWSNLSTFDEKALETWDGLKFTPHLLKESYLPLSYQYGSLNCITNCFNRIT